VAGPSRSIGDWVPKVPLSHICTASSKARSNPINPPSRRPRTSNPSPGVCLLGSLSVAPPLLEVWGIGNYKVLGALPFKYLTPYLGEPIHERNKTVGVLQITRLRPAPPHKPPDIHPLPQERGNSEREGAVFLVIVGEERDSKVI